MEQITMPEAEGISGAGFSLKGFGLSQIFSIPLDWVKDQVLAGNVDYAGVAESQGTYYNTVGA